MPQPLLEPLRRWDPERIGPYTLLGRLGAGAMGQVYLGRSMAGRLVAVKTIKIEFAEEAGFRARFAHEVAAARRVSGVFTAAVVAADPDADMPWLATAYVPAPSLNRLVRACGPLPVRAIRWLAAGCAEALESIHVAGLVHRDLKPSNVLVSPDGPRVIDFGVARAAERVQLTTTRGAVGTPAYMAPEQARDTRQASVASDVFSLGATLLFAATGHPPYLGETVMDVLVRLATEAPDLTGLPTELTSLITSCLERSPRQRPTSAALLSELGPFVDAAPGPGIARSYLTDSAVALIAEYQRAPQTADGTGETGVTGGTGESIDTGDTAGTGEEATFGSATGLPRARPWAARRWLAPRQRKPAAPPGAGAWPSRSTQNGRPRRRTGVMAATLAVGAVVLVAAGMLAGRSLYGPSTQAQTPGDASSSARGPSWGQPLGQPFGPPPGPPTAIPTQTSSTPKLWMSQPFGDGYTVFVVHGAGFAPFTRVTVALAGHGASRLRPVADRRGTFNYAFDQGHIFFRGWIPPGIYRVVVTGSGGRRATASFQVGPLQPGGGPPPPAG